MAHSVRGGSIGTQFTVILPRTRHNGEMSHASLFATPDHQPFYWRGGTAAALLIHGFPGTPAEMRAIGQALHEGGWSVQGLLLPGFGSDFATLGHRRHADWIHAIASALHGLRQDHATVVLVGNSMGGALALRTALHHPVDGIVLFAPFWRVDSWLDKTYPVAARLLPSVRPFAGANFKNPRIRAGVRSLLPDADLDDPEVRAAVRRLSLPMHALGQVRHSGQLAYDAAPQVHAPVMIVQGQDDPLVKPRLTQQLARRLPNLAGYLEVPGQHEIVRGATPAWAEVTDAVRRFLAGIAEAETKAVATVTQS